MGLLRILLAICVLCGHSEPFWHLPWLTPDLAVESFFVISGFYMQLVLSGKYTKERLGRTWSLQFYKARYFRLFPTYAMGCLLAMSIALIWQRLPPVSVWQYLRAMSDSAGNVFFKAFLCFTNLTMLFQDVTMFFASNHGAIHWSANFWESEQPLWPGLIIPQGWSLGIELSFYLLAPYLLKWRSRWLAIAALLGFTLKVAFVHQFHLGDPWTYRFFPFELGYFLVGALAYRNRAKLDWFLPLKSGKYFSYAIALVFAVLSVAVPLATLVYPLTLGLLIPSMFRVTAADHVDRMIGELSYPFYIFHLTALTVMAGVKHYWWPSGPSSAWTGLILALVLSAIGLVIETRFVEPWRARFAENKAPGRAPRMESVA